MKVYISADIEGVSGITSWSQCGRPRADHYDFGWARERMTADVNAAIRGAKKGGATEIVVKDSHGNSKNLLVDKLESGVTLISGHGAGHGGMMAGLDRTYAAALLVGYHAMAGTSNAIMEHTITGGIHRVKINGMPAGEIAMSAGIAGCYDVPIVMISSDRAGCEEATKLLPGITSASVKEGMGRYMGKCLHPDVTAKLIEDAAEEGVHRASSLDPWLPDTPCTISIEFNRSEDADCAGRLVGVRRTDAYTLEYTADSWAEVHQMAWSLFLYATMGSQSDQ